MLAKILTRVSSLFPVTTPPGTEGNALQVEAVPGLTTLLDFALFRAVEGELTATVTSGHALLGE
jgi:hypothetical protein